MSNLQQIEWLRSVQQMGYGMKIAFPEFLPGEYRGFTFRPAQQTPDWKEPANENRP